MSIVKKIATEPLLYFLFIGYLLYLYYGATSPVVPEDKITIELRAEEFDALPEVKRNVMIQKSYYEAILLNEAYTMKLERQDKESRKRLLKQMEQILLSSSKIEEPSEETLYNYYLQNIKEYSKIKSISFAQIYFADASTEELDEFLKAMKIASVSPLNAIAFTDKCSVPNVMSTNGSKEVEPLFGKYFTSKLFRLKEGIWQGPIYSKLGSHLVYISDKNVSGAYGFDEVQDRVYEDYMAQERQRVEDEAYKKISSQYLLKLK